MAISRVSQVSVQAGFPKSNTLWDGVSAVGGMEAINFVVVPSGGSGDIEFNNIPQTYSHLQLRIFAKSNRSSSITDVTFQLNGHTGNNYMTHSLYGNGATAYASVNSNQPNTFFGRIGANSASNLYGGGVFDIYNYTSSTAYKTIRSLSGTDANGSGEIYIASGTDYTNTDPVTSIKLGSYSGTGFIQYSSFALYGIK